MKTPTYKINSAFVSATSKAKALSKLKAFAKIIDCKVSKVRNWSGGKTGDKYGKNYWFDYDMKPIKR